MPAFVMPAKKKVRARPEKLRKGSLVKGVSSVLPADLLDEPHFKEKLTELIRGYAGIYILYSGTGLYYIGLARSLYTRLKQHTKDSHRGKWDGFAIYRINQVRYLKDIESLLIRIVNPPGNSVSGHFHRDADMTRMLREIARMQKRRIRAIGRALGTK